MSAVTAASRHFTASAIVFDIPRRLVLLVDHLAEGRRQFPGGHVDPDQAGCEAAVREVLEETGVTATPVWLRGQFRIPGSVRHPEPLVEYERAAPPKPHKGEPAHHHIDLLYLMTADSAAPVVAQLEEVAGAHWVPIDDLGQVREDVPPLVALAWKHITGTNL